MVTLQFLLRNTLVSARGAAGEPPWPGGIISEYM
jgi:hypothetical protein